MCTVLSELVAITDYPAYVFLIHQFHDNHYITDWLHYKLGKEEDFNRRKELFYKRMLRPLSRERVLLKQVLPKVGIVCKI